MADRVLPLAKMEEVQETRAAVLLIDRAMLRQVLMLPEHMKVGAVHYDWERDALGIRLDSATFPVAEEYKLLPRMHPTYERRVLESGEAITTLRSLEGEDGVDYAK